MKCVLTFLLTILAMVPFSILFAQSPGGVSTGMTVWLKADAGVEEAPGDPAEDGDAITRWLDNSVGGFHFISVSGPTYRTGVQNFNPMVEILSGGFDAPAGSELSTDWTTFFISKKLASDNDGRVFDGHIGNYLWAHWGNYTNSIYINNNPSNFNSGIATTSGIENLHLHAYKRESTGGTLEARADGTSLTTFASSNSGSGVRIDINQGAFSGETSDSQVGEMIIYNSALTGPEIIRVESYLAIKYGLTVTHNYVASNGTTIWDATVNAAYHFDIAGIGRDDNSGLIQPKSLSINTDAAITLDKGSAFANDGDYIIWGNNNSTGKNGNVPPGYVERSARVWKVGVAGSPGTVNFSIDLSILNLPITNAADYALLIDDDTDFSTDATVHIGGATLVGSILSFTGVSLSDNDFFTIAQSNVNVPGGVVGDIAVWLKADNGVEEAPGDPAEDGDVISKWLDNSGGGFDYTVVAGPTYKDNTLNFNPTVEILSGGFDAPPGSELSTDWTTFFISRKLASDNDGRLFDGHIGNYLWAHWGNYTNSIYINGSPSNYNSGIATTLGIEVLHLHTYKRESPGGTLEARADGNTLSIFGSSNSASGVRIDINQGFYSGETSDSQVGEMIIYRTALSGAEVDQVESYLALKYGLTLPHNYLASDGTLLWDVTANAAFQNDVAGIGLDALSGLDQRKSKSIHTSAGITIDKGGSFGSDKAFLVWGSNNGTGTNFNAPAGQELRSNRVWKMSVAGSPGVVSLTIDLSIIGIPNTGSVSDYTLLIDTDTDFTTGSTEHTTGASLVGNLLTFSSVSISNGNFVSLAANNVELPGGIAGAILWLKADAGVTGTTNVSVWADQSGSGNDVFQGTPANQPSLASSSLNFNPAIDFSDPTDVMQLTTPPANLNTTVFSVAIPAPSATWRTMFRGNANDHPIIVESGSTRLGYYDNDNGAFKYSGFNWPEGIPSLVGLEMRTGDVNFRQNGTQGASITTINLAGLNLDYFGNYQLGSQRFGRITETMIFSTASPLGTTEKEQIESYLAVKYGITLSHNYLATSGLVIWNTTTNAGYNNDIAGIGRDNISGLSQTKSMSVNADGAVTIDKGGALGSDLDFLLWGNNDGAGLSTNTPPTYSVRSGRIWKTAVTGAPGNVNFSIDLGKVAIPNTGSAADYALLMDSDTDFSAGATVHITGANLVGNILSFTGVNFSNNNFFSIAAMNVSVPGGVSGAVFWVKADVGVSGTTNVSAWADQSGNSNNATQGVMANQPSLIDNDLNFNPSINFSGGTHIMSLPTPPANLNATIFAVGKPRVNTSWRTMFRGATNDHPIIVETGGTNLGYYDGDNAGFKSSGFTWLENEPALVSVEMRAGNVNFRKNGTQGASITTITLSALNLNYFGNYQGDNQQFGDIEEAIVFQTTPALTTTEKEQVESYLGLKYGLTLAHNYLSGLSSVVWDATSNAIYHNNVAGIGKDSKTGLNQKQTMSQRSGAVVTIGLGTIAVDNASNANSFAADQSFFVYGNNAAALNSGGVTDVGTTVNSEMIEARLNRVWLAEETGTIGSLKLRFDLSAVPGSTGILGDNDLNDVRLLVDTDGTFATGATSIAPTGFDNSTDIVEFDHDFSGGTGFYFTIGSVDKNNAPLPVQLLSLSVELNAAGEANVSWATASELNNDYFTVERSKEGTIWDSIGTVPGKGTSTTKHAYNYVDRHPYTEISYYRLRQTDFDGSAITSGVIVLYGRVETSEILIYPNPSNGEFIIEGRELGNASLTLTNILGQAFPVSSEQDNGMIRVNISSLPRGSYVLIVQNAERITWKKIILK